MRKFRDLEMHGHVLLPDGVWDMINSVKDANKARDTAANLYLDQSDYIGAGLKFRNWDQLVEFFKRPWKEGIDNVYRLMDEFRDAIVDYPTSIKRRRKWNESEGEVDVDRAFNGEAEFMSEFKRQVHTAPKNIVIIYNTDASYFTHWRDFAWGGIALAAATDLLEAAGYYCEIWICEGGPGALRGIDNTCPDKFICTKVKESLDALDVDFIAKVFSSWYMRLVTFGAVACIHPNASYGTVMSSNRIVPYVDKYLEASTGVTKIFVPIIGSKKDAMFHANRVLREAQESRPDTETSMWAGGLTNTITFNAPRVI